MVRQERYRKKAINSTKVYKHLTVTIFLSGFLSCGKSGTSSLNGDIVLKEGSSQESYAFDVRVSAPGDLPLEERSILVYKCPPSYTDPATECTEEIKRTSGRSFLRALTIASGMDSRLLRFSRVEDFEKERDAIQKIIASANPPLSAEEKLSAETELAYLTVNEEKVRGLLGIVVPLTDSGSTEIRSFQVKSYALLRAALGDLSLSNFKIPGEAFTLFDKDTGLIWARKEKICWYAANDLGTPRGEKCFVPKVVETKGSNFRVEEFKDYTPRTNQFNHYHTYIVLSSNSGDDAPEQAGCRNGYKMRLPSRNEVDTVKSVVPLIPTWLAGENVSLYVPGAGTTRFFTMAEWMERRAVWKAYEVSTVDRKLMAIGASCVAYAEEIDPNGDLDGDEVENSLDRCVHRSVDRKEVVVLDDPARRGCTRSQLTNEVFRANNFSDIKRVPQPPSTPGSKPVINSRWTLDGLGIRTERVTATVNGTTQAGLRITSLVTISPVANVGIQAGDTILKVNTVIAEDTTILIDQLSTIKNSTIQIGRGGKPASNGQYEFQSVSVSDILFRTQ